MSRTNNGYKHAGQYLWPLRFNSEWAKVLSSYYDESGIPLPVVAMDNLYSE